MRRRYRRVAAPALLALLAGAGGVAGVAGCTSSNSGGPAPAGPAPAGPASTAKPLPATADWPTYHGNAQRTGAVSGLPAAGRLFIRWSRRLNGAVYGQPLIIGSTVIAATESNRVYGLSRTSGRVLWSVQAASGHPRPLSDQPCGNLNPLGITSTPVYDPATRLVYVLAETTGGKKVLAGIRVSNGQVAMRRVVPTPDGHAAYDQQRGALALADGRIYVVFGGHFGDCGPYRGSVAGIPASGDGPIVSYVIPTVKQAGIWASGGPVVSPWGTIYVAAGNGAALKPPFDGSDSVIALTPQLKRIGVFAPRRWPQDNAGDLDLGSSSPALLPGGRILQVGKSQIGYLLNARRLGGVGGQLAEGQVCASFGGPAVSGSTVYVPCYGSGLSAVSVAHGRVQVLWRGPSTASGSPVVGGGAVWVADWDTGILYQLSQANGRVRHRIGLGAALPHFVSPSLSGSLVLIGTLHGVVAVSGA